MDVSALSRRERQIMDILYTAGAATVRQVVAALPNAPTDKAVRRMLEILEEKGHVQRKKIGREYTYRPVQPKKVAGKKALRRLLDTFFDGEFDKALAIHLGAAQSNISDDELRRMLNLVQEARKKGR